jgi:hypothetical protein
MVAHCAVPKCAPRFRRRAPLHDKGRATAAGLLHFCKGIPAPTRIFLVWISVSTVTSFHSLNERSPDQFVSRFANNSSLTETATRTMTRAMHIDPVCTQGFAARGIGSCVRREPAGFLNASPMRLGAAATT